MPRIPACTRNVGDFKCLNILSDAMCGGNIGGVWLVICLGYWRVAGCILQLWKLACSRRVFMVSVGVGRLLWSGNILLFLRLRSHKVDRVG